MSRSLHESRIFEDLRKIYRLIVSSCLTIVGLFRIWDDLFGPSHPGIILPWPRRVLIKRNKKAIILVSSCLGSWLVPSSWPHPGILNQVLFEKRETAKIGVFCFWPNPIILVCRTIILFFTSRPAYNELQCIVAKLCKYCLSN